MNRTITRRALLGSGLSLVGTVALAEAPFSALRPMARPGGEIQASGGPGRPGKRPQARLDAGAFVAAANLGGVTGFVLADLADGRPLDSGSPIEALPPASVTKVLTALYALDTLGGDHRFATRLFATGPVEGGRIQGDLILAGGGDPVLTTDHLADLAAALRASGVTGVTGRFAVWGGALPYLREIDTTQQAHLGYNPAVSGLNLNFNRVHFEWARAGSSYTVAMDARTERFRPTVQVARMRVVDRDLPIYTWSDSDGVDDWTVARPALGNGGSRWLPVRRPALYAGDVFRTLAQAQGIALSDPMEIETLPAGAEVAAHRSDPTTILARDMLLYSTNLTAEALGLSASAERAGELVGLSASAARMSGWLAAQFGTSARFVDHSGLGDSSRMTAADMVNVLASPGTNATLAPLLKPIPLTDANGDLLARQPGSVVAKTGTLNFVSALAGYLRTESGRDLAFAIFSANLERRTAAGAAGEEVPEGASAWNSRARRLQQQLLQHWARVHG